MMDQGAVFYWTATICSDFGYGDLEEGVRPDQEMASGPPVEMRQSADTLELFLVGRDVSDQALLVGEHLHLAGMSRTSDQQVMTTTVHTSSFGQPCSSATLIGTASGNGAD